MLVKGNVTGDPSCYNDTVCDDVLRLTLLTLIFLTDIIYYPNASSGLAGICL